MADRQAKRPAAPGRRRGCRLMNRRCARVSRASVPPCKRGVFPVAGCDEAGRGPLAGPVVAAAVILDPRRIPRGLDDSKKLSAADAGEAL